MAKFWYIPTIIYVVSILLGIGAAFLFRYFQNRRRKPTKRETIVTAASESSASGRTPAPQSRGRSKETRPAEEMEMTPLRPSEHPGTSGGAVGTTTPPVASGSSTPTSSAKKTKTKESIKQS